MNETISRLAAEWAALIAESNKKERPLIFKEEQKVKARVEKELAK